MSERQYQEKVAEIAQLLSERDEAREATKLAYCILAKVNRPSREAAYARSAIKHVNDTPMDWLQSLIQKWKEAAK